MANHATAADVETMQYILRNDWSTEIDGEMVYVGQKNPTLFLTHLPRILRSAYLYAVPHE